MFGVSHHSDNLDVSLGAGPAAPPYSPSDRLPRVPEEIFREGFVHYNNLGGFSVVLFGDAASGNKLFVKSQKISGSNSVLFYHHVLVRLAGVSGDSNVGSVSVAR